MDIDFLNTAYHTLERKLEGLVKWAAEGCLRDITLIARSGGPGVKCISDQYVRRIVGSREYLNADKFRIMPEAKDAPYQSELRSYIIYSDYLGVLKEAAKRLDKVLTRLWKIKRRLVFDISRTPLRSSGEPDSFKISSFLTSPDVVLQELSAA